MNFYPPNKSKSKNENEYLSASFLEVNEFLRG